MPFFGHILTLPGQNPWLLWIPQLAAVCSNDNDNSTQNRELRKPMPNRHYSRMICELQVGYPSLGRI